MCDTSRSSREYNSNSLLINDSIVAMPINITYPGGKSVSKLNGMDSNWRFFRLLIATHYVGYSDSTCI